MDSERKLASVQQIVALDPIPNADSIEKATVLGWECVVKKGEFQVGDLCVYFEIDSILPQVPLFEFLAARKYRVKTIKLRGQVSQGLAIPYTMVVDAFRDLTTTPFVGMDVTAALGVKKHDPQVRAESTQAQTGAGKSFIVRYMLRYTWFRKLYQTLNHPTEWPGFVPKTDEERVQNTPNIGTRYAGNAAYYTEKLDGQSATYCYRPWHKGGFYVCSRNICPRSRSGTHWRIALAYRLKEKLRPFRDIAIQGEIVGPSIQKNRYQLTDIDFYVFNMYDVRQKRYLTLDERLTWCTRLGLKHVPVLGRLLITGELTVPKLVEMSKGTSQLLATQMREGIVMRRVHDEKVSFKVINPDYLLKFDNGTEPDEAE